MAREADFKHSEWITLQAVFCAIVLDVAIADRTLDDAEAKAWHTEVDALVCTATPLVRALLISEDGRCADDAAISQAVAVPLGTLMAKAGAILKAKATPEEIEDYRRSVRSLAVAVAEAAPGGDSAENKMLATVNDLLLDW